MPSNFLLDKFQENFFSSYLSVYFLFWGRLLANVCLLRRLLLYPNFKSNWVVILLYIFGKKKSFLACSLFLVSFLVCDCAQRCMKKNVNRCKYFCLLKWSSLIQVELEHFKHKLKLYTKIHTTKHKKKLVKEKIRLD